MIRIKSHEYLLYPLYLLSWDMVEELLSVRKIKRISCFIIIEKKWVTEVIKESTTQSLLGMPWNSLEIKPLVLFRVFPSFSTHKYTAVT